MNISGIRTYAGFYDYNTIQINAARGQQIQEAKAATSVPDAPLEETSSEAVVVAAPRAPDRGAEEYAKQYQPDATYELKGADSDIGGLDVEKALSDMKKDQVLQQYQFFISETNPLKSEGLNNLRENENFIL